MPKHERERDLARREAAARALEATADQRLELHEERMREADQREALADQREHEADDREQRLSVLDTGRQLRERAQEKLARSQEAIARSEAKIARGAASVRRSHDRDIRDQSNIDRQTEMSRREGLRQPVAPATGDAPEAHPAIGEAMRRAANRIARARALIASARTFCQAANQSPAPGQMRPIRMVNSGQ